MIKLFGWESLMGGRIKAQRADDRKWEEERRNRGWVTGYLHRFQNFFSPIIVYCAYAYTGNTISLAFLNLAQTYIGRLQSVRWYIPHINRQRKGIRDRMKDIQEFLDMKDTQENVINKKCDHIHIKGNFSWGFKLRKDETEEEKLEREKRKEERDEWKPHKISHFRHLKDIDLKINKGEFVCIIGDVGSGKTNLLNAMLGEMLYLDEAALKDAGDEEHDEQWYKAYVDRVYGRKITDCPIKMCGSTSLVEAKPWIRNDNLRKIIQFGQDYKEDFYKDTIRACQLEPDFKSFAAGDLSEIGEGGINLSGGQKARTALARAVYANADILVMDDPVSALDATLRKNIFLEVFNGLCKDKTRILATHAVDFLNLADRVVIMNEGRIDAQGKFEDLKESNDILKRILKAYYENQEELLKESDEPLDLSKPLEFTPLNKGAKSTINRNTLGQL